MHGRTMRTVDHPWTKLAVTICALLGTLGGGGAFFKYLGDRDAANAVARQSSDASLRGRLELEMTVTDLQQQVAAGVLLIAAQGRQLKQLHEAFTKLTSGQRRGAAAVLGAIEIPMTQGEPILGGRVLPRPETYVAKKKAIRAKLDLLDAQQLMAPTAPRAQD